MESVFKETLAKARFKLQEVIFKLSAAVKGFLSMVNMEDELIGSERTFYLLSLMLLLFLIFLSPDKVPQAFSPEHVETGIFEKAHEITRIIKKLISSLV